MVTSWKTTSAGAAAIFGAVASLLSMASKGQIDGNVLMTDIGVISAGIMGLFAKDNNVTGGTIDNRTGVPVPDTSPTANPTSTNIYSSAQRR
jgi:hypothetical protein